MMINGKSWVEQVKGDQKGRCRHLLSQLLPANNILPTILLIFTLLIFIVLIFIVLILIVLFPGLIIQKIPAVIDIALISAYTFPCKKDGHAVSEKK